MVLMRIPEGKEPGGLLALAQAKWASLQAYSKLPRNPRLGRRGCWTSEQELQTGDCPCTPSISHERAILLASVPKCAQACFLQHSSALGAPTAPPRLQASPLRPQCLIPILKGEKAWQPPLGGGVRPTQNALNFSFTERFI